jgi:hypothetical protein
MTVIQSKRTWWNACNICGLPIGADGACIDAHAITHQAAGAYRRLTTHS